MTEPTRGRRTARAALLAALLFQGLSGIAGGIGLIADPTGGAVGIPVEWLEGSPFPDYLIPGLVLLLVLGLAPLAGAWGMWRDRGWAPAASAMVGAALLVWLAVEIAVIGYQRDPPLQATYGGVGVVILILGLMASVGTRPPGVLGSSGTGDPPGSSNGTDLVNARHLLWIPAGAAVGFAASFVFGDRLTLPVDLYYLIYFAIVLAFLSLYVQRTGLDLRRWVSRRLVPGVLLGILGGLVLMQGVLARPETAHLDGAALGGALAWRGLVYGAVDGLLLLAFPWAVVWRAFGAEEGRWTTKTGAGAVALLSVLLITTTYHLGYRDFRSRKIVQPNLGSVIGAVPTLLAANPVASPVSHVFLHVTAVLHAPRTDLFLPPHRE